MIDNFDFSDTKQVRKTLLISSFAGICFKILVSHSTGNIEFLGFKIPVKDATIIPVMIGCMIIYEMLVLVIRYNDENLREIYKQKNEYLEKFGPLDRSFKLNAGKLMADQQFYVHPIKVTLVKHGVKFIDILFPLILGLISLLIIFLY